MTLSWLHLGIASGAIAAIAALATAAMPPPPSDGPVRMSGLHVSGLADYPVEDSYGALVGKVVNVETDHDGRTRYVVIALNAGGEARVASFRAFLDQRTHLIAVSLPQDTLATRGNAAIT
jgi:hypothetical protein